jgi:hypothetical protein
MKKLIYLIPMMLLMTSCGLFQFDNYETYDASIKGAFIDETTGVNVQQECVYTVSFGGTISSYTTGYISAYELGWDYEAAQNWLVKSDGSYLNTKIFAGKYRLEAQQNNFYPIVKSDVVLKEGSNTVDWTVVPYVRIIDPVITYDATVSKFKAAFKCQYGDATKADSIYKAVFCIYPDVFVGMSCNNSDDPGASKKAVDIVCDGTTVNTLYIDPAYVSTKHNSEFKYSRTHYLRIAVCSIGTKGKNFNSSYHYNFSPIVPIEY